MRLAALLLVACHPAAAPVDDGTVDETDTDADADTDTDSDADTDSGTAPSTCPTPEPGVFVDVTDTDAGPYFLREPAVVDDTTPTIVFLPGGDGSQQNAEGLQANYLQGDGNEPFRLVVPYTTGARDFSQKPDRAVDIRDEVLACLGGNPDDVHLGGVSNGGLGSFSLFVDTAGAGWASLLGAPGAWDPFDEDAAVAALGDKPLFMGVGELDDGWRDAVQAQADALAARGVDVTFVVFAGQEHVVTHDFDETVLFDFWRAAATD